MSPPYSTLSGKTKIAARGRCIGNQMVSVVKAIKWWTLSPPGGSNGRGGVSEKNPIVIASKADKIEAFRYVRIESGWCNAYLCAMSSLRTTSFYRCLSCLSKVNYCSFSRVKNETLSFLLTQPSKTTLNNWCIKNMGIMCYVFSRVSVPIWHRYWSWCRWHTQLL